MTIYSVISKSYDSSKWDYSVVADIVMSLCTHDRKSDTFQTAYDYNNWSVP